ncbi:MAG: CotH kinase family protein [Saprospiraceae bacterium]|nr:CotH kinase family protein [Saprospiraceae bacterium]MBP7679727.1 CotH kinase family protein [Saprospiraceae bacterium]
MEYSLQHKGYITLYIIICWVLNNYAASAQDLYDANYIPELKITFQQRSWLQQLKINKDKKNYLLASIELNGIRYDSVGVRFKGNSSYNSISRKEKKKLPFNIKFNYIKKEQVLPGGYATLKLSNVFRDPSYIREVLSYEIARKYIKAPKANFVKVFINDELFGVYTNVESIDKMFLQKHFPNTSGSNNLIKADPDVDVARPSFCPQNAALPVLEYLGEDSVCYTHLYELDTPYGWKQFINLTRTLAKSPDKINQVLDIDRTLWWLALNNVMVNLDSYLGNLAHNYYMVQDSSTRFMPIIWDLNLSFGGFRFADLDRALSDTDLIQFSLFHQLENKQRPLINVLLNQPQYRKMYLAHVKTILEENFSNGDYRKRAEAWQNTIAIAIQSESNRLYPYELFRANRTESVNIDDKTRIIGVTELMDKRTTYLLSLPALAAEQPILSEPKNFVQDAEMIVQVRAEKATKVYLYYRNDKQPYFSSVVMADNGESNDIEKGDKIFGAKIEAYPNTSYYFFAENDKTGSFLPALSAQKPINNP